MLPSTLLVAYALLHCRKRCEKDGKYLEARAASVRLAELKTQEAQRMRQAIMERQVCHALLGMSYACPISHLCGGCLSRVPSQ